MSAPGIETTSKAKQKHLKVTISSDLKQRVSECVNHTTRLLQSHGPAAAWLGSGTAHLNAESQSVVFILAESPTAQNPTAACTLWYLGDWDIFPLLQTLQMLLDSKYKLSALILAIAVLQGLPAGAHVQPAHGAAGRWSLHPHSFHPCSFLISETNLWSLEHCFLTLWTKVGKARTCLSMG